MSTIDDEIDLWDLWEAIWSGRWFVVLATIAFSLGGAAYAIFAPEWFRAEIVLAPTEQQSNTGGALSGLGLGGLAGIAGINLGGGNEQQPVAVLRSRDFARQFIEDLGILPDILAKVRRRPEPLDIRDAVDMFDREIRSVSEDTRTGLVTLSIRWTDADTAALWANTLATRLNDRMRQQSSEEAERNVSYLKEEMALTRIVSLQQALGTVLEAEMQKLLLARGNEEFAFRVIDRAVAPKDPISPKRALIVVVSFLTGGFLAILALVFRDAVRRRTTKQ